MKMTGSNELFDNLFLKIKSIKLDFSSSSSHKKIRPIPGLWEVEEAGQIVIIAGIARKPNVLELNEVRIENFEVLSTLASSMFAPRINQIAGSLNTFKN
jgi:hypothetical protein